MHSRSRKSLLLKNVFSGYSLYLIHSIKGAAAAPMQASRPAPPSPPSRVSSLGLLDYYDSFLGKSMHIRLAQSVQVDTPFHLIETAAARLHLPRGYAVEHEQARSPSAYTHVPLWPAQLQRVAIGFTCAASHALATAPASVHAHLMTTRRWGTRILVRVMGGLVGKIQVCRARCLCRVLFDARCSKLWWIAGCCALCTLTSSAGCVPPLPSTPGSAMQPVPLSSVAHRS